MNIKKLDDEERKKLCLDLNLPQRFFDEDRPFAVEMGKFESDRTDGKQTSYYILSYDMLDEIVAQQFESHRRFHEDFFAGIFRFHEVRCFIDTRRNHMVYKELRSPEYYGYENGRLSLYLYRSVVLGLIELWRTFEHRKALFNSNAGVNYLFTSTGKGRLEPRSIVRLYAAGAQSYLPAGDSPVQAQNRHREKYRIGVAQNDVHRLSLLTFLTAFLNVLRVPGIVGAEAQLIRNLLEESQRLRTAMLAGRVGLYRWSEMVEFVRSWGHQGRLFELIRHEPN